MVQGLAERLREYVVQHEENCERNETRDESQCTCGLDTVMAEVKILEEKAAEFKAFQVKVIDMLQALEHANEAAGRANESDQYRQGGRETTRGLINSEQVGAIYGSLSLQGWVPPAKHWRRISEGVVGRR